MDKRRNQGANPTGIIVSSRYLKSITYLIFAGAIMLFSCTKNDITLINNLTQADTLPTQTIHTLITVYMDTGRVQMIVKAPVVMNYTDREEPVMIFPKGIKVEFFNPEGEKETILQAGYAVYYQKKNLWEAKDSVIAENNQNERLDAELLFWNVNEKRIYSDKFVRITTPDEIIFGEGFESDQAFNDWQINHVKGTVFIETQTKNEPGPAATVKKK